MKTASTIAAVLLLVLASAHAQASAPLGAAPPAVEVGVDPARPWYGWMNRWDLPEDGGAYAGGEFWGVADLAALFAGPTLTLLPNTSLDRDVPTDPYWWKPDGRSNKILGAQVLDLLPATPGQALVFSGQVLSNTLAPGYTSFAVVFGFDAAYNLLVQTSTPLLHGQPFVVQQTPGQDIAFLAYGFDTYGPAARIGQNLGSVVVATVPEPAGWALLAGGLLVVGALRRRGAAA